MLNHFCTTLDCAPVISWRKKKQFWTRLSPIWVVYICSSASASTSQWIWHSPSPIMGATFWFDLFVLCYYLLAVDGLPQKANSGDVNVQQKTSWQQGQTEIRKMESLLARQQHWPVVGLKRRQESTFSLDQGLSNTKDDTQNAVRIYTTEPNMITANIEDCQPLSRLRARGGKEGQALPLVPNLECPLPAITGTDIPQSGQGQQSPTTGSGGDERQDEQAPGDTKHENPISIPNLFRIPMDDGDNPTCYDATYGLMPVGVCQNPELTPEPSKYDVFMSRNIDIYPRAWKLIDSLPGASSPFSPLHDPRHKFCL